MTACPHSPLNHPDLVVRPPGQPLPAPLAQHPGPLADQFQRWLRQRDDPLHAAQKHALTRALRAVSDDDVRRVAEHQAALALPAGWDHWIWAVPAATVASLLGLRVETLEDQRALVAQLRAIAAGLVPDAVARAVAQADEATLALLDALRAAEAATPDAPLQWALLHHAGPAAWPDTAMREANRLALVWQSHEAGSALLGHGLWSLAKTGTPPDRAALREIAQAGGAVRLTRRFAWQATSCEGQSLAAGDPLTVDLTSGELAFGDGPHRCPGPGIALASIEAALSWAATQRQSPWPTDFHPLRLANLDIPLPHTQSAPMEVPA